jgi:hypothetical protein
VSGPLFSFGSTPTSIALTSLEVDGSNGNETSLSSYSTTWTGLWTAPSSSWANIHINGCQIHCTQKSHAKAVDLSYAIWTLIENTDISGIAVGWGVYIAAPGSESTTITLRKVYLHYNLECVYVGPIVFNFDAYDTVFESSLVAMSAYDSLINLTGCYFENIGYWGPSSSPLQGTALTLQNMGIGNGISAPVNTALHFRQGNVTLRGCWFSNLSPSGGAVAWVRGVGLGQAWGGYGRVTFDLCRRASFPNDVLIAPETSPPTIGGFSFVVNDPVTLETSGPPNYIIYPGGVVQAYADARAVSVGRVMVAFSSSDARPVAVQNGLFVYGQFPDNAYTTYLGSAPAGGTNMVGDTVLNSAPAAGGCMGWICVGAGNPGTWKTYAPIGT